MTVDEEPVMHYLQSLLLVINDAVAIINARGETVYWNQAAERTYDIPEAAIIGQPISDFFREEDLAVLQMLETERPLEGIYHQPLPGKSVLINASPIYDQQQQLIGAVSVEHDITHVVKLNEALSDTSSELSQLRQKMSQSQSESVFSKIIGQSQAIQQVIELSMKVAQTNATVLITGESGSGKELFAQVVHESSPRGDEPFIPINCGAVPQALFESELFGYAAGAFTGASSQGKPGKLEMANGGTLFLDEVGDLPMAMQVKLLRALQEQEIYRVGGTTAQAIDVRIIAATNIDLEQRVRDKQFRADLYYRLNVVSLHIPSLRDRQEDLPDLVQVFIEQLAAKHQTAIPTFDFEAMSLLLAYDWPGNIRELRNIIERTIILTETTEIGRRELAKVFPGVTKAAEDTEQDRLKDQTSQLEKEHIMKVLGKTYGNKSAAAKELGISRTNLYKK